MQSLGIRKQNKMSRNPEKIQTRVRSETKIYPLKKTAFSDFNHDKNNSTKKNSPQDRRDQIHLSLIFSGIRNILFCFGITPVFTRAGFAKRILLIESH